ncbi:uncharacterized protein LOC121755973 [Salvia splendens]|uniref:uncharacterized protein LOC121755973 n=1 Tax=Salvia splendens TaxID=180675 RepID=UPI001C25D536|nr:uncharacterized protein LOC121755973 [Salvia splendens]
MAELCLMASHGCHPPGLGVASHQELAPIRVSDEFHHFLPYNGSRQDLVDPLLFNLSGLHKEEWRSPSGLFDPITYSDLARRVGSMQSLSFKTDTSLDSVPSGSGIVERCAKQEKILKLLASGSVEEEDPLLNLSMLYDLAGPQSLIADLPLIYPTGELFLKEPSLDLAEDRSYTGTEMADMLTIISDIHSLKKMNKSSRQTMLVPYFEWRRKASASTNASKLATEKVMSPKSNDKVKEKTPRKKKTTRDSYSSSYLHACESLLSVIMDRKQPGGNTILSLKKSGPQLPRLLNQFSASIAGTGIAVVLSVLCRAAYSQLPLCASKILSTGLGLGLVWLAWAVNRLRDTVVSISKTSSKGDVKEEEMVSALDRNLKDIYFRVITLVAVVALKVA